MWPYFLFSFDFFSGGSGAALDVSTTYALPIENLFNYVVDFASGTCLCAQSA